MCIVELSWIFRDVEESISNEGQKHKIDNIILILKRRIERDSEYFRISRITRLYESCQLNS